MLNLRERTLEPGAMRLLTGLLRNNRDVQEIDLGGTNLQRESALALLETLVANSTVTALHLPFNPAIDESAQAAMLSMIEKQNMKILLSF
jgi:hypothetical protein